MKQLRYKIKKLLHDKDINYFQENQLFQDEILNQYKAARILVEFLYTEPDDNIERVQNMLSLFNSVALKPLAVGLSWGIIKKDIVEWRIRLLHIIWIIMSELNQEEKKDSLYMMYPYLTPLLDDNNIILPKIKNGIDIDNLYRVCDEFYMFIREIQDPEYDESDFIDMNFEERDEEIKLYRKQLNNENV